jgi:hypothetical protein
MGVKVSELTAATSLTGAELVPVVQGGVSKYATVSLFGTVIAAAEFVGASGSTNESVGVSLVTRTGAGVYTIALSSALTLSPLVVVSVDNATAIIATATGDSVTQFTVRTFDAAGAAADAAKVYFALINPGW